MQANFGHYPVLQKTLGHILESANGGQDDQDRYGVQMDEFTDLIDDEDYFDAGTGNGPNPPIAEELRAHVPVCEIEMDIDDNTVRSKARVSGEKSKSTKNIQEVQEDPEALDNPNCNGDTLGAPPAVVQCDTYTQNKARGTFIVNQMAYNMFRPGYTIVLYGPRRSGKSKLIKNVCQRIRHYFPDVVVFTMTKSSGEYFSYVPYHRVIEGLDEDLLDKLIEHQMRKKEAKSRGEDVGNTNLLIIIDDCMAEGLRYKKTFNRLFYNGRHSDITLIVAVQDVRGVAPSATINADIACSFSLPDHRGRDTVREKFVDYLTRDEFDNLYDHPVINQKYHVVCFDIAHRYNPLDKRISIGCVDEAAELPFVLGNREMWTETAASKRQLIELGFEHLLDMEDWGIVKPRYADPKKTASRLKTTKNSYHKKSK